MSECPQCGMSISADKVNYCSGCGEDIEVCSNCENIVSAESSFCNSCGESLSEDYNQEDVPEGESVDPETSKDYTNVGEPNSKVSTFKAMIYGIIPGASSSLYVKNIIGGCPSCGEGKDLTVTSKTGIMDFNPFSVNDNDIECNRCGSLIENDGRWMKIVEGEPLIEGKSISESESMRLAKYRRQKRTDDYRDLAENLSNKRVADDNTDKAIGIASRVYYYPIALIIFLFGAVITSTTGRVSDFMLSTIMGGLALPDIRKMIAEAVGFSLPWWGRIILGILYGFLGLIMLLGLLLFPTM